MAQHDKFLCSGSGIECTAISFVGHKVVRCVCMWPVGCAIDWDVDQYGNHLQWPAPAMLEDTQNDLPVVDWVFVSTVKRNSCGIVSAKSCVLIPCTMDIQLGP
ncbi:unnamed protein product [Ostreobium quekettii]|uniref:Uncharacterized protein n=1 Tax=Ostreobium quekettii TaxID=121088 RepID=A0A8S1J1T2_9CHLO|nr:unnamed protein product [Ostreobium quekettii]